MVLVPPAKGPVTGLIGEGRPPRNPRALVIPAQAGTHLSAWQSAGKGHDSKNCTAITETCGTMDGGTPICWPLEKYRRPNPL